MKTKFILLVEDNRDDEELTTLALKDSGLFNEIIVVRDGEEALHFLFAEGKYAERDPTELPCVVLLDLNLPKIDGIVVLERLRANPRTKYLPVAVLTSSKEQEDRLNSYQLGANSFVRKPVEYARFADAVKQLGLYWALLNEPPDQE